MNLTYLQTFAYQVTKHLFVPLSATFLIEILSSLQIIQLIFSSMAKLSPDSDFIITSFNKNLRFLTGAFPLSEVSVYNSMFHGVWIFCLIYFLFHVILFLAIIKGGKNRGLKRIKILSWLYLLHSRVIFFPLQFFLLNLCNLHNSAKPPSDIEFYQEAGWLAGSIILLVVNTSLALCKEFIIYQINQTESHYSMKTNLYHQLIIIYKIIALLLGFWDTNGTSTAVKGITVFHLVMALSLLSVLYVRLPFYKFSVLKLIIILATVILCLSGVSLIYAFTVEEASEASGGMHILILLLPPLGIKLILSQFRSLFQRILQGKFMVVNHAIHFALLIEDFISKEKENRRRDEEFLPNRERFYGVLAAAENKIPLEIFSEKCESEIYLHIGNTLRSVLLKNPYSKALALFKAQLNMRKLDDIPRTLEILRRFEGISNSLSLPIKGSIRYVNDRLEDFYNADGLGSETRLNLSHYFKYYEKAGLIKSLMLIETKKQIEFWEDLQKRDLDVKKMYDRVEEIDELFVKTKRECEVNLNNFRKNFSSPMLLYSVYLNNVRRMHHEGAQILRSYESIMLAQSGQPEVASGNVAVVLVSLDKAKPGLILNTFGSIQDIFNIRKAELIGKKFGCLFPNYIAQNYQQNIQQYAKTPEFKLDFKENTYGKTSNDEIFELEAHFQLYPSIKKELILLVMLRKIDDPAPVLIANNDGHIVDCSRTLEVLLQRESLNVKGFQALQNINPGLEDVNLAFNIVSNQSPLQVQSAKSWFGSDHTGMDFEESSRWTLLPGLIASSDRNKKLLLSSRMSVERAEALCREYQEGKYIVLSQEKNSQVKAHVSFKPFQTGEEVYKVVRISDLKKEPIVSCFEFSQDNDDDLPTLGDEFIASDKRVISPLKAPKTKAAIGSTLVAEDKKDEKSESHSHFEDYPNEVEQKPNKLRDFGGEQDERSSVMNSHHLESRAVRTLREIGSRKKLQWNLCSLQISLYVVIGLVLILSFVKFEVSKSSIEEIQKGINIINLATLRRQNAINTFLWSLVYVTGVNPSEALGYLATSMVKFTESSTQLEHELGLMTNQDFLDRAFKKDVRFWQLPVQGDTKNEMTIDTFVATNILMGKYLAIQEAQSIYEIYMMPDLLLVFNNTANDYILSSNDFITATDTILGEIISRDIVLLKVILSIEIVALVGYIMIFITMIWITSKSYQRLCRALLRSPEILITQRISQLDKVRALLESDIETKAFIQEGLNLFVEKHASDARVQNQAHQSNVQMSSMKKYFVRIVIICLLFIPIFFALFVSTLVRSIHTFNDLADVNEELSVLSDGSLQSNLMMSTLIYGSMNAGYPRMLIMNKSPVLQIAQNFQKFNGLNQRLIETFFSSKQRDIDPFLIEILQTDACKALNGVSREFCEYATNGQNLGLLSINTDYYNILQNIVTSVGINATLADALVVYADSLNKIIGEMNTMMEIYPIMTSHILGGFGKMAENSKSDERRYIIVIFVMMIGNVVFLYLKPMKDFRRVDIGRRKILKIIPVSVIQENKALKFYLMQDFKTEVEEIKNKL